MAPHTGPHWGPHTGTLEGNAQLEAGPMGNPSSLRLGLSQRAWACAGHSAERTARKPSALQQPKVVGRGHWARDKVLENQVTSRREGAHFHARCVQM